MRTSSDPWQWECPQIPGSGNALTSLAVGMSVLSPVEAQLTRRDAEVKEVTDMPRSVPVRAERGDFPVNSHTNRKAVQGGKKRRTGCLLYNKY